MLPYRATVVPHTPLFQRIGSEVKQVKPFLYFLFKEKEKGKIRKSASLPSLNNGTAPTRPHQSSLFPRFNRSFGS
jgi:hypothetical protein